MRGDILVVDDEAGPRESLRMILKRDHDVRTATSGREGLAEIERRPPDLVLLDLRLGDMNGTDVLTEVKTRHPQVEVAIITAYAAVESARLAVRYGAIDYLTKPYLAADVERIVERALAARRKDHDAALLAAQLAKMSEALAGRLHALEPGAREGLADAVNGIEAVNTSLGEDIEAVRRLTELGEMAASVTHDINNLLTIILTSAEGLLMQLDAPRPADGAAITPQVARIARAAEDCSAMIRQVKQFARLNVKAELVPIDINAVVNSVVELLRGDPRIAGGRVRLDVSLGDITLIAGDEVGLRTLLMNLLENSLEALPDGGTIRITTGLGNDRVCLEVADDGSGMSPEVLARATEAFFTADKPAGTGLGLSIVERVVTRHEGELALDSQPGHGTTVIVRLPTRPGQPSAEEDAAEASHRAPCIVVAEDNEGMRELMARLLEGEGYDVLRASDGLEGWDLFRQAWNREQAPPMMLITDQEMPGMLGRDLVARVKALDERIPVILVSGYLVPNDPGPEDVLFCKPFDFEALLTRTRQMMPKAGG